MVNIGGTAGCIIASRLADADPNLSVLVIEGGPNNYNEPLIVHPAFFFSNLAPGTKTIAFKVGNKSEHLANRELVVPTANVLGGGSSVNFSLYSRAQRTDLDSWQTPGWSADELLPYMKKVYLALPSSFLSTKCFRLKRIMAQTRKAYMEPTVQSSFPVARIVLLESKTTFSTLSRQWATLKLRI